MTFFVVLYSIVVPLLLLLLLLIFSPCICVLCSRELIMMVNVFFKFYLTINLDT